MNQLIDTYYSSVYNSVVRLSGLSDENELKFLTGEILDDLRLRKEELAADSRKGIFIYKIVLIHVFAYLESTGSTQRIEFLQKILLIHPSHYRRLPGNGDPI